MATILELVTILKPNLLENEQMSLADTIDKFSKEYYAKDWIQLEKFDLLSEEVQNKLIRTIFQLQYGNYDGIANEILSSLMSWTGGTVIFRDFPPDENELYQRAFGLIGFQNFSNINVTKQIYLLGSRFLPLGPMLGIDIKTNVELHFTNYCAIDILESESQTFAGAVRNNQTLLFDKPIAKWIEDFLKSGVDTVNAYLEKQSENNQLKQGGARLLGTILDLYIELVTGVIWKEVEKSDCVHGHIEEMVKQKNENISPDELYLQELMKIPKIEIWLEDTEEIVNWLRTKNLVFIKKLFTVLAKKINLIDEQQLDLTLKLINFCEENAIFSDSVLLFNETTSQFEWNTEFLN